MRTQLSDVPNSKARMRAFLLAGLVLATLLQLPANAATQTELSPELADPAANPCADTTRPDAGSCVVTLSPPAGIPTAAFTTGSNPAATTSYAAAQPSFACDGDGQSGKRVQLSYVVYEGSPNRFEQAKDTLLAMAAQMDTFFRESALKTGGERRIRFVHDANCTPTFRNLTVTSPQTSLDPFIPLNPDRLNLNFIDTPDNCGATLLQLDDHPGPGNVNSNGGVGWLGPLCWNTFSLLNLTVTVMGAVQHSAPHSDGMGGCTQFRDPLCYDNVEPAEGEPMDCPDYDSWFLLDCGDDDYFHTNPAPGSYLDTHWNVANNPFLIGAAPNTACYDKLSEPNESAAQASPLTLYMPNQQTTTLRAWDLYRFGFCTPGDEDWIKVPLERGKQYKIQGRSFDEDYSWGLEVYAQDGNQLIAAADWGHSWPWVSFTPRQTGDYLIRLWNPENLPSPGQAYGLKVMPFNESDRIGQMSGTGFNGFGELHVDPHAVSWLPNPQVVATENMPGAVSAGLFHTLTIEGDKVRAAGWNAFGQLGNGDTVNRTSATVVNEEGRSGALADVVQVSAGYIHSLALKKDGTVWAWGSNVFNQLGDGTVNDSLRPKRVAGLDHVVKISAGSLHNLALKDDGTVWAWGWNGTGGLGDGSTNSAALPFQVPGLSNVTSISAGLVHSLAVSGPGSVWAWGWNGTGALGDGTRTDRYSPVRVFGLEGAREVAAGYLHSVALKKDGAVLAWGSNALKQAGGNTDGLTPRPVACHEGESSCPRHHGTNFLGRATWISAGAYHSVMQGTDGSLWGWGWNGLHQLGNRMGGSMTAAPVQIGERWSLAGVHDVSAGAYNTVFTSNDLNRLQNFQ